MLGLADVVLKRAEVAKDLGLRTLETRRPTTPRHLGGALAAGQPDSPVREREQYGNEEWAKDATSRYTRVSE